VTVKENESVKIKSLFREWMTMISPPVFFGAAGMVVAFIIFGSVWTETAGQVFTASLNFIAEHFQSYYIVSVSFFLLFVIWLFFSRFGNIKLGSDDSRPEFSRLSWFAMLFAAGMGMGLVFWGVAEPVYHYMQPPLAEAGSAEAVRESMRFTFFHWGFHAWAIYIIFGLGIAYYHFRHGLPLAPRSLLYPIIGERYRGWIGHFVDAFCTVGTLLGVATSLGLGAMQINFGFTELLGIDYNAGVQMGIIIIITLIATLSTVSGVSRGIRYLSLINILLAVALMIFVFFAGPTLYQLKTLVSTTADYLTTLPTNSFWIDNRAGNDWQKNWTVFYWGWWISWSPFVGIFIARVSRGRTVREFIIFVFIIPTVLTFLWLSIFGGTALHIELFGSGGIAVAVKGNVASSLSALLGNLPLASFTRWTGLLLIIIFFITSSDSGSLVDDMVTSGGHPDPPALQRVFWGFSEGAVAAVLLVAGGLKALQAASISAGLPQSFLIIAACIGLLISFRKEKRRL
jgi:choline/glycine/proline betaine transport protein